jgi:hypothetical protein
MIFGLHFGGPAIPDTPRTAFRKFPKRLRLACKRCEGTGRLERTDTMSVPICRPCDGKGKVWYELQGIGQSPEERDAMLVVANNANRLLHVHAVQTVGAVWFGIYVY